MGPSEAEKNNNDLKGSEIQDSENKEFCVFNLYYSYHLLTSTINHVFDNYYYSLSNGKCWSIVCCVVQNCLYAKYL